MSHNQSAATMRPSLFYAAARRADRMETRAWAPSPVFTVIRNLKRERGILVASDRAYPSLTLRVENGLANGS